jgi:coenzyme F420-0:L-glutamate ligase/coenzyme F420-1:gamma-L-glutamate ligase
MRTLHLTALPGLPEISAGDDLSTLLASAARNAGLALQPGDILVLAQKIVSKAEGRRVSLASVTPSNRAQEIAREANKDPRFVELIMANAGIDQSNLPGAEDAVLLLPEDPDASARRLQDIIAKQTGSAIGVLIIDSFGRAWRHGVTGMAIGVANLPALVDMRGDTDREGRVLKVTQVAAADELAAAASLVMGQAREGTPAVLARGFPYALRKSSVQELLRPEAEDLFR